MDKIHSKENFSYSHMERKVQALFSSAVSHDSIIHNKTKETSCVGWLVLGRQALTCSITELGLRSVNCTDDLLASSVNIRQAVPHCS